MGLVVGWAMVFAPATAALVMGVVGYPLYRRQPGGMAAFQRSGLWWWFGTLAGLVAVGAAAYPEMFAWEEPSRATHPTVARAVLWAAIGMVGALVVEIVDDRLPGGDDAATTAAFLDVLPTAARKPTGLRVAVVLMAVLEEAAFRALLLGFLLGPVGMSVTPAAVVCALVFGISHWWYGARQIALKSLDGAMFVLAALGGGWLAAVAAHVLFNLVITEMSTRQAVSGTGRGSDA